MSDFLTFKEVGDPFPSVDEWNALVLSAKNNISYQDGNYDGIKTNVQTDRGWQPPYFTAIWEGTGTLLPYSVVQIKKDTPYDFIDPLIQNTNDYSDGILFITNDDAGVNNGDPYVAYIIGQYPIKALYSSSNQPVVGEECGPNISHEISSKGSGLLCLSLPDSSSEWVWVASLGGGSKSIQMGKLDENVTNNSESEVPLLAEDLSADGFETQENVINITGLTLLENSVVYIFKQAGWPVGVDNTASHTMYPAQLASCPLVDPEAEITE